MKMIVFGYSIQMKVQFPIDNDIKIGGISFIGVIINKTNGYQIVYPMNKSTFGRHKAKIINPNKSLAYTHQRKPSSHTNITHTENPIFIGLHHVRFNATLLQPHTYIELQGDQAPCTPTKHTSKEIKNMMLVIEGTQLHISHNHHVKHSFDILESAHTVNSTTEKGKKSVANYMIQLPCHYTLTVSSINKHIQVKVEEEPPAGQLKVIKPVELLEEAVRVRALKLNKSARKGHQQSTSKLNIHWNKVDGVEFKSSLEKISRGSPSSQASRLRIEQISVADDGESSVVYTGHKSSTSCLMEENRAPEQPKANPACSTTKKKGMKGSQKSKAEKSLMLRSTRPGKPQSSGSLIGKNFGKDISHSKITQVSRTLIPFKR